MAVWSSAASPASAPGNRSDPFLGFRFRVEIDGLEVGGFSEVSGLQVETEVKEYREGGVNDFIHKLAGPTRYPANLNLKHGLITDVLWQWAASVRKGEISPKLVTIHLLDMTGGAVVSWTFADAYPVKWSGPDLRAESNTVAIESVELVHKGML